MNTVNKPEWRLVPVEPTQEMMQAMDESSPATYWRRCPWKAALNAAPTPQASEPVAVVDYKSGSKEHDPVRLNELTIMPYKPIKEFKPGTKLYDHAKPCERCAELEQRMHKLALDWQVKENKLAALEAKIEQLSRESSACDMIEEYRQDAQTTADALGHLQRQLEAVSKDRDDWIACHAKIFRELQEARATIAQQAERIKELEAAIERMRTAGGKNEFQKAFDAAKGLLLL